MRKKGNISGTGTKRTAGRKGAKNPLQPHRQGGGQVQPAKLEIKRLSDGVDPGEAFFYIADSLQVMNGHLRRIADACEKAGGM